MRPPLVLAAALALATPRGPLAGEAHAQSVGAPAGPVCLSVGGDFALVVAADSTIWGYGVGEGGELGIVPGTGERDPRRPFRLEDAPKAVAVAAGAGHALALLPDRTVRAWGRNEAGELGLSTSSGSQLRPVEVSGIENAVAIAAGTRSSLALLADGTVRYWGDGAEGRPGTGTLLRSGMAAASVSQPVRVKGLRDVVAIASGDGFSLALLRDSTVMQWGAGRRLPERAGTLTAITAISAGATAVALRRDGTVWEWLPSDVPTKVAGLTSVVALDAGQEHSQAVVTGGRVVGWGDRHGGRLGTSKPHASGPAFAEGVAGARSVSAGNAMSAAALADGRLVGWGTFETARHVVEELPVPLDIAGSLPADCRQAGTPSR